MLWFILLFLTETGYVDLKHQLYNFTTKSQALKCALGLVLLVY